MNRMGRPASWLLTARGRTQSVYQWSKETGLSPSTLKRRIACGFDAERILAIDWRYRPGPRRMLAVDGVTLPLVEWARIAGRPRSTIEARLRRGETPATAVSSINNGWRRKILVDFQGEKICILQMAKKTGISSSTLYHRVRMGWTDEQLALPPTKMNAFKWEWKVVDGKQRCA